MGMRSLYDIARNILGPELAERVLISPEAALRIDRAWKEAQAKIVADQIAIQAAFNKRQRRINELKRISGAA